MAEGATPAERTTGGKEAPSIPGTREAAVARVSNYRPPGVERGVTGKERRYQQNRAFGPGAMKPYPYEGIARPPKTNQNLKPGNPNARGRRSGGTYGSYKAQNSRGVHQNPEVT